LACSEKPWTLAQRVPMLDVGWRTASCASFVHIILPDRGTDNRVDLCGEVLRGGHPIPQGNGHRDDPLVCRHPENDLEYRKYKAAFHALLWSLPAPRRRQPRAPGSHPPASPEHQLGSLAGCQHGWQRSESARCHSQRRRQLACSRPSPSPARRWQRETGKFFGMDAKASDEELRRRAPDHPVYRRPHGSKPTAARWQTPPRRAPSTVP